MVLFRSVTWRSKPIISPVDSQICSYHRISLDSSFINTLLVITMDVTVSYCRDVCAIADNPVMAQHDDSLVRLRKQLCILSPFLFFLLPDFTIVIMLTALTITINATIECIVWWVSQLFVFKSNFLMMDPLPKTIPCTYTVATETYFYLNRHSWFSHPWINKAKSSGAKCLRCKNHCIWK